MINNVQMVTLFKSFLTAIVKIIWLNTKNVILFLFGIFKTSAGLF